jgi:FkbM family methyltransferase
LPRFSPNLESSANVRAMTAPPASYRLAAVMLRRLPAGSGQHPAAARVLRRKPLARGTLTRCRMRSGVDITLDLGIEQEATAWLLGHYESGTVAFLAAALPPDGVFLDVGANVGLIATAVAAERPGAQVHCFEADPVTAARLDQNAVPQMRVIHAAVTEHSGEIRISGESTMLTRVTTGDGIAVTAVTLDDYVAKNELPRVDVAKIDVEGHELQVLRGSTDLIARFRPTIVCEAAGHGDDNGVARFLEDRGYRRSPIPPIGLQHLRPRAALDRNVAFVAA